MTTTTIAYATEQQPHAQEGCDTSHHGPDMPAPSCAKYQPSREKNPQRVKIPTPWDRHEDLFHWSIAPMKQRMLPNSFTDAKIDVAAQLVLPTKPGSVHVCGIAHSKGTRPGGQLAALLPCNSVAPGTGSTRWRRTPGMLVVSPSFSYAPSGPGEHVRQW